MALCLSVLSRRLSKGEEQIDLVFLACRLLSANMQIRREKCAQYGKLQRVQSPTMTRVLNATAVEQNRQFVTRFQDELAPNNTPRRNCLDFVRPF